jgi:hypothetical protein
VDFLVNRPSIRHRSSPQESLLGRRHENEEFGTVKRRSAWRHGGAPRRQRRYFRRYKGFVQLTGRRPSGGGARFGSKATVARKAFDDLTLELFIWGHACAPHRDTQCAADGVAPNRRRRQRSVVPRANNALIPEEVPPRPVRRSAMPPSRKRLPWRFLYFRGCAPSPPRMLLVGRFRYRLGEMPVQSCGQSVRAPRKKAGAWLNSHTDLRAKRQRSAREKVYRNRPVSWRGR